MGTHYEDMSTPEYTEILKQLKAVKADATTGLEHDRAIMAFVFFNFCLLILLLILVVMIYKIMPRGGSAPPVTTTYMSPMPPPPPPVISMPGPMPSMAPPMRQMKEQVPQQYMPQAQWPAHVKWRTERWLKALRCSALNSKGRRAAKVSHQQAAVTLAGCRRMGKSVLACRECGLNHLPYGTDGKRGR